MTSKIASIAKAAHLRSAAVRALFSRLQALALPLLAYGNPRVAGDEGRAYPRPKHAPVFGTLVQM